MEGYPGRDHQYHYDACSAAQSPAHHNSSSFMSAGRFKMPHLPRRGIPRTTSQPFAQTSYLGHGQSYLPFPDDEPHHGETSLLNFTYQNDLETLQSPVTDFMYDYRQVPLALNADQYGTHNMMSAGLSLHYGTPQTFNIYASNTSYPRSIKPTPEYSMQELIQNEHQVYTTSKPIISSCHSDYPSQSQITQQTTAEDNIISLRDAFEHYQMQTKEIFTLVRDRQLEPTAGLLLQISRFLIGNVQALGLDRDDIKQYEYRLRLWDIFNNCWLTVLYSQYKTTQVMAQTGQYTLLGQSVMTSDTLEAMGRELVRLCDSIEKMGLVDYQMGVAEERIIDASPANKLGMHITNKESSSVQISTWEPIALAYARLLCFLSSYHRASSSHPSEVSSVHLSIQSTAIIDMGLPDTPGELANGKLVCEDHGLQVCHDCLCDYTFMDDLSDQGKKSGKDIVKSKLIRNFVDEVEKLAACGVQVLWKKVPRVLNYGADLLAKDAAVVSRGEVRLVRWAREAETGGLPLRRHG
ncbi:hypothetical protein AUEXF2481DRAFT_30869 [Aureobasidium subglaciale EXF-2481]|uniref:Uncharacterized protein n=1 Tax=Aureobasidium subglaciale (strain EXF-2481) TaxID=1043005 RepID=A0A074Y7M8_AURSE|nr:uncharacterized protein AUEXF2481DRAFT_30869 [Aureobasidium subglaciale EXF-2481]KEQ93788.1 hypothetical protein AUEXF2481DRAFT_30869 [Aureobasidium subglaciale EXF-2481]